MPGYSFAYALQISERAARYWQFDGGYKISMIAKMKNKKQICRYPNDCLAYRQFGGTNLCKFER
jgi:hypothetical protein